jgi:hypothetical protein
MTIGIQVNVLFTTYKGAAVLQMLIYGFSLIRHIRTRRESNWFLYLNIHSICTRTQL